MDRHCKGVRADGSPCRSVAVDDTGHCFAHSPRNTPAERQAARAKGGKHSATAARLEKAIPADLLGVRAGLLEAFADTRAGTLGPKTATALAVLARAIVAVHETAEQDGRITALEERIDAVRRGA